MTRFFHDGCEIGFTEAIAIMCAQIGDASYTP
jgi:hypothetical protein